MKPAKRFFSWLKKTVGLGFGYVKNHQFISVETTEQLKKLVRSNVIHTAVRLTPTKFDDTVHAIVDSIVIPILQEVAIANGIIREHEKSSTAVSAILERIKVLKPNEEAKIYADFAGRLNHRLSDGVLTLAEAWEQAQDTFFTFFKKS